MRTLLVLVVAASVLPTVVLPAISPATWKRVSEPPRQTGRPGGLLSSRTLPPPLPQPVHVDVIATDSRGRIVGNLKAADFELRENGRPQTLEEIRLVTTGGSGTGAEAPPIGSLSDERTEAARADTRLFAVFLDEYHVSAGNSRRVREALTRFVDENLGPRDLVVVRRPLEPLLTIQTTRDRDLVRRLIDQFEGRKGDYTPRNDYERNYVGGTPSRIEQLRDQVTVSALNALALHLGSLNHETRKTLVAVSEGLPRVDHRRGLEALPTADSVTRAANRSNVSVYVVDPREAAIEDVAAGERDVLRTVVAATDGRWIAVPGDLAAGMRPIANDSSAYYLLAYRPSQQPDGLFHALQVTVKRAGVNVRTRMGYWASMPDEEWRASLDRPVTPAVLGPPRRVSPLIQPWFGTARGPDGKTRITLVWEPSVRVPGDCIRQAPAALVVLKALGADGAPLFDGAVKPTGMLRFDRAEEMSARAVFDAPPGPLQLQMSIEDDATQAIDSDVREITVRNLNAPVALSTPEILRARTARDYRALENDPDAVPVVSRVFSRSERLIIRLAAYGPPGTPLTVSAKLLSRTGQARRELESQKGAPPSTVNRIDRPLASLAAGEYLVEFAAKSPAGQVKDLLPLRVTP